MTTSCWCRHDSKRARKGNDMSLKKTRQKLWKFYSDTEIVKRTSKQPKTTVYNPVDARNFESNRAISSRSGYLRIVVEELLFTKETNWNASFWRSLGNSNCVKPWETQLGYDGVKMTRGNLVSLTKVLAHPLSQLMNWQWHCCIKRYPEATPATHYELYERDRL